MNKNDNIDIIDLDLYKFNYSNVYDNLKELPEFFNIKNDNNIFSCKKYIHQSKYIEIQSNYLKSHDLNNFSILFIDYKNNKKNNNCYIRDIHKSQYHTGTQIIEMLIIWY